VHTTILRRRKKIKMGWSAVGEREGEREGERNMYIKRNGSRE